MFACIVAGRPAQTNLVQVDSLKYLFVLTEAQAINHICVFLTTPFPDNYGASVYYKYHNNPAFIPLGILTNDKPSAVFKLKHKPVEDNSMTDDESIQLGISIEPLETVLQIQRSRSIEMSTSMTDLGPENIVQKVVENFYNFCAGFYSGDYIPVKVFQVRSRIMQDWYTRTMTKMKNDPSAGFLLKN